MRNTSGKMCNAKCKTMVIGQHVRPHDDRNYYQFSLHHAWTVHW